MSEDLTSMIILPWPRYLASLRGHVAAVYQIAWSADSRLLVSGSSDSTLKVWDVKAQKLATDLPGHADEVRPTLLGAGGIEAWPSSTRCPHCPTFPLLWFRCMLSTGVLTARGWQAVGRTNAFGCEFGGGRGWCAWLSFPSFSHSL